MSLERLFIEPRLFRNGDLEKVKVTVEIVCNRRLQGIVSDIFKYVSSMVLARYPSSISKIEVNEPK